MKSLSEARHEPPPGSVMTIFRFRDPEEPQAIVIGPSHSPYYVYPDGHIETVAPEAEEH
ncbi:MAG TPA: hypothetical protein VFW47_00490 [Phenylobacterium sp.]|nr:hypothetical protein [Phenylobacterium sp.]